MLSLCDIQITSDQYVLNQTLISVFGLVVQTPVTTPIPDTDPINTYLMGSYRVRDYGTLSTLDCSCGRAPTEVVVSEDLSRAHPVAGRYCCSLCQEEDRNAKSPSDRVAVWLAQNRPLLNPDDHLLLPRDFKRLVDRDGTIMRPKRFIYAKFYETTLSVKDKIMTTCNCENCVNPYHMMRTQSPATKVTPQMKEDVRSWLNKNMSNKTIQQLIEIKYSCSLSLRTITNLKKSVLA